MPKFGARMATAAILVAAAVGTTLVASAAASGSDGRSHRNSVRTDLTGYEEVPSVSSPGSGTFRAQIDERNKKITFTLSYRGLPTAVTQAHIHFGGTAMEGGVIAFLCSNIDAPTAGTQACPPSGTITGTIRPANVVGPVDQGIAPGEFAEVLAAIRAGFTYINVHTDQFPDGEIRGQLSRH